MALAIGNSYTSLEQLVCKVYILLVLILALATDCMYDYQQFMTDPAHPTPGNTRFDASALWKQSTVTREQIANCSAVKN